tara:strand:- start:31 stop:570 length:540 start_codon:yes stop_codon:yes gene_type:complete
MFKDKGKDVTQEDIYNECYPPTNSNKLIAEFMGVEEAYNPNGNDFVFKTTIPDINGDTDILESCKVSSLSYHKSWDWLMPVVQKIGDDYYNTPFDETYSKLTEGYENIWTIEDTYNAVVEFIKEYKKYPFNEGDDYYTIEDGEVIWSCWDDESEEMHDENPNKQYFRTKKEAENYNQNN